VRTGVSARAALAAIVLVVAATGAGCAYFNTFHSARKSFAAAESQMAGQQDPEARATASAAGLYDKAIEGGAKVVRQYSKSKWVDDAVLLIGRSLLGKGEYAGAQLKFTELVVNFSGSELCDQATYWSGVAAERDRRRPEAIVLYDSLLTGYPQSKLRDEALLRRSNLYLLLRQPEKAESSLRELAQRKDKLGYDAGIKLAEALFAGKRYAEARPEFARVAERAPTEQLRQDARLRVGDCDEALGDREAAVRTYQALLRDAKTEDGKARARLRYASALGLAGRADAGLRELANVIADQPRTPWAAEAAFRSGYLYEVVLDDLASARRAYDGVAEQQPGSPFVAQAKARRDNLDRLDVFRVAQGDTSAGDAAAEALFQSGELYLFRLGKPDKAFEEYARLEREHPDSPLAPRAVFAQGWVQARRLGDVPGAKATLERLIARWPDAAIAAVARRLLANPIDSVSVLDDLPPASVQFPLVPGNPLYVPPPPVVAARSTAKPVKAAADSSAAAALQTGMIDAHRDSLRARADSMRAAQRGAIADTTRAPEP